VDGGIYIHNINIPAENGANCYVSGTGIFGAENPKEMISSMRKEVEKILLK
jgi:pentose-5-phosphate-3-epimerase